MIYDSFERIGMNHNIFILGENMQEFIIVGDDGSSTIILDNSL